MNKHLLDYMSARKHCCKLQVSDFLQLLHFNFHVTLSFGKRQTAVTL